MSDVYNFNYYKIDDKTRKLIKVQDERAINFVRMYLIQANKLPDVVAEIIISFWMDLYLLRMFYRLTIQVREKYDQRIDELKTLDNISRISLALEVFPVIRQDLEAKQEYYLMFLRILGDSDLKNLIRKTVKNYPRVAGIINKWRTQWNTDYSAQYQLKEFLFAHQNDFLRHLKSMSHRVLKEDTTLKKVVGKCHHMLKDLKNFNYIVRLVMKANVKIQDPDNPNLRFWNWTKFSNPYRSWNNYYSRHPAPEITTAWWMAEKTRDKNIEMCHDICGRWRDYDPDYALEEDELKAKKATRKAQKAIEAIKRINETAHDWVSIREVRDGQVIEYDQPLGREHDGYSSSEEVWHWND